MESVRFSTDEKTNKVVNSPQLATELKKEKNKSIIEDMNKYI